MDDQQILSEQRRFNPKLRAVPNECTCPNCMTALGLMIQFDKGEGPTIGSLSELISHAAKEEYEKFYAELSYTEQFHLWRQLSERIMPKFMMAVAVVSEHKPETKE